MIHAQGFISTIIAAGVVGALAVTVLCILWTWRFDPGAFQYGAYGLLCLHTFPCGWLIGTVLGSMVGMLNMNIPKPDYPFATSIGLIVGGTVVAPLVGIIVTMMFGLLVFVCQTAIQALNTLKKR